MKKELKVLDIVKRFEQHKGYITVLNGITHTFSSGYSYAITGASGTGKSTLLHILAGLTAPTSGSVSINGQNITLLNTKQREQFLQTSVGLLFQMPYLINELTVMQNVMTKAYIAGSVNHEHKKQARDLLKQMGLLEKADETPPTLSGGQQQRVALARALFNKPAFLLADEPTGNLDPKTGALIVDLLGEYQQKWGMGVIVSTHDQYVAERLQQQFVLRDGQLTYAHAG